MQFIRVLYVNFLIQEFDPATLCSISVYCICQLPYTRILLTLLHVVYPCTVCQLPYIKILPRYSHVVYLCTACQLAYRETNHIQES